jgi:hypothetical protein
MLKKRGSYEVSNCTIEIDRYKELRQYVTKKHTYQIVKCTSKIDESDEYLQYSKNCGQWQKTITRGNNGRMKLTL